MEASRSYVIVDARGPAAYKEGHVEGSRVVDATVWTKAFAADKEPTFWGKEIGKLGIDGTKPVVVYDKGGSTEAARVWWLLRFWGVKDVRILNGGWKAWRALGGKEQRTETPFTANVFAVKPHRDRLATKSQLLESVKGDKLDQLLDVRSTGEFCGDVAQAARGGTIPGAKHLEWTETINPETGTFRQADELAALFRAAGIDPKKPSTTFCQSGGRAAVMAFVLELMGGHEVRNYYRSWSEWGNDPDAPVTRPTKK